MLKIDPRVVEQYVQPDIDEAIYNFEVTWWFAEKNNIPTGIVVGQVVRETDKAFLIEGHLGYMPTINCTSCKRQLTNPVSRMVRMGPICYSKAMGVPMHLTGDWDRDLARAKQVLLDHKFRGWMPKACILRQQPQSEVEKMLQDQWEHVKEEFRFTEISEGE